MRKLRTVILGAYLATACSAGIGAKFGVGSGGGSTPPPAPPAETPAETATEQAAGEPGATAEADTLLVADSKATKPLVSVQTAAIGGYSGADGLDILVDAGRNLYYVSHKIGPVAETICSDRFGYSPFEPVTPPAKRIELGGVPDGELKACVEIFTIEGQGYVGRYNLTAGGVMSTVGFSSTTADNGDDYRAPVRVGDRLSFFHWSECGDGCGACSLTYADISDGDVKPGKTHNIPCEARARFAVACEGKGGTGICSAAKPGGVSFWQENQ